MKPALDYWLSKLMFDLHTNRALGDEYRKNRDEILLRYPLSDPVLRALRQDDVAFLAGLTNGFLLRYYFLVIGMTDRNFIDRLQPPKKPAVPGVRHG